jgi:hypothetical protein
MNMNTGVNFPAPRRGERQRKKKREREFVYGSEEE